MGLMSRQKGAGGERLVVAYLNALGYDARRVIRTRAVGGYGDDIVPDVTATKDGTLHTFEVKLRKDKFKTIYDVYDLEKGPDNVFRFIKGAGGVGVSMGTDFDEVNKQGNILFKEMAGLEGKRSKTYNRIIAMKELLKGADFLVIKDNHKPLLFIKYLFIKYGRL